MSVTYQLHLMLNAEQLMLGVDAAVGARLEVNAEVDEVVGAEADVVQDGLE